MATAQQPQTEFVKAISRLDATALVVGSMIGSGIFIVSAEILREVHAPGFLLLVWAVSGVVTLMGALTYGELAAMFPKAGGQYVYLREGIGPLFGYLYGWTLFVVIQTGTIAAVAVAFATYAGELWPALASAPLPSGVTPTQLVAVGVILALTAINARGLELGRIVQNVFTVAKVGTLLAVIILGLVLGGGSARAANLGQPPLAITARLPHVYAGLATSRIPTSAVTAPR